MTNIQQNAFIFYLADNLEDEKLWKQGESLSGL